MKQKIVKFMPFGSIEVLIKPIYDIQLIKSDVIKIHFDNNRFSFYSNVFFYISYSVIY